MEDYKSDYEKMVHNSKDFFTWVKEFSFDFILKSQQNFEEIQSFKWITKLQNSKEFKHHREIVIKQMNLARSSGSGILEGVQESSECLANKSTLHRLHIMYYISWMKQHGEKIYKISENIAEKLRNTKIDIQCKNIKVPFKTLFIEFPEMFYFTNLEQNITYPCCCFVVCCNQVIHISFFVNSKSYYPLEFFEIDLTSDSFFKAVENGFSSSDILSNVSESGNKIQESDCFLEDSKIPEDIRKKIISLQNEQYSKMSHANKKVLHEASAFILNCLLYITSVDADIMEQFPIPIKCNPGLSKKAQQKFKEKQSQGRSTVPYYLVGGKIIPKGIQYDHNYIKSDEWKINKRYTRSAHWRWQWRGTDRLGTKEQYHRWIDECECGPEFAEVVNKVRVVEPSTVLVS